MTFTEGTLRPDALSAPGGRLHLTVHLPWYRSLPVSCLESLAVTVDGTAAPVGRVALPGFAGAVAEAAASDSTWDLRDPLHVDLEVAARPDEVHDVEVALAVRIPYLQRAPGVPLVQHVTARAEATVR